MLPSSRYALYTTHKFMNALPYAVRALSTKANEFVYVTIGNNLGESYKYGVKAVDSLTKTEFSIHSGISHWLKHLLPSDSTYMHYVHFNKDSIPHEISALKEDNFIQISLRTAEAPITNLYTAAEGYKPFQVESLTAKLNIMIAKIIKEITSEEATYEYSEDSTSSPILLGDGLNTEEEF